MMKKIISVILLCIFLFTSSSCAVLAYDSEPDCTVYCEELLAAIGVDIKIADESAVTRSEFIYMLMQILNFDDVSGSPNSFSDVASGVYYSSSVSAALNMKIISASDKFYPDNPIKFAEMCKMAVSALDYDYTAISKGGYPTGYIATADSIDLLDGVSISDNLTKANVLTFFWNFLHADVNTVTGISLDPEPYSIYTPVKNALYVFHNIYYIEDYVTETENSGLYESASRCEKGYVTIGETTYKAASPYTDMLGMNVVAYISENNSSDELVYMYSKDNKTIDISYDNVNEITSNGLTYIDGEREKKAVFGTDSAVIYNGAATENRSVKSLVTDSSSLELIDNNSDGKYDVVKINDYEILYVESANLEKMMILDKNNGIVYLDETDIRLSVYKNGLPVSLETLSAGDILRVYRSIDNIAVKIVVDSTKTVNGKIEELNISEKTLTVNGNKYSYGKYFEQNYANSIRLGKSGAFVVGSDGIVYAVAAESADNIEYGYFVGVSTQSGLDSGILVKIFSQSGEMKVYSLADKVRLNGVITERDKLGVKVFGQDGHGEKQLIRYMASSENEVTMIDTYDGIYNTVSGNENEYDNLVLFKYPSNVYSTVGYIPSARMFHPYFKVVDSTAIFLVADDDTVDESIRYRMDSSRAYINLNRFIPSDSLYAYNVSDSGIAGAILIKTDGGNEAIEYTSRSGIVFSVNQAVNTDGEEGIAIVIYSDGKYNRYFIVDEQVLKNMNSESGFASPGIVPGDYIRFNSNDMNVISAVTVDFSIESSEVKFKFENHVADLSYYYGPVYTKADGMIAIKAENIFGKDVDIYNHEYRYTFPLSSTVTIYDTDIKKIYEGKSSEIIPYLADGDNCSKLLVKTSDGVVTAMILYN